MIYYSFKWAVQDLQNACLSLRSSPTSWALLQDVFLTEIFLQEPFGRTCPLLPDLTAKSDLIEKHMLDSVAHGSHMVENDVVFSL